MRERREKKERGERRERERIQNQGVRERENTKPRCYTTQQSRGSSQFLQKFQGCLYRNKKTF